MTAVIFPSSSETPPTSTGTASVIRSATDSALIGQAKKSMQEYEYGWNDPPAAVYPTPSTPNRPPGSRAVTSPGQI